MMRKLSQAALFVIVVGMVMAVAGCTCICRKSAKAGIPIILCQPMDPYLANIQQSAVFHVKAKGENLSYQWYTRNSKGISPMEGAVTPELVIAASNPNASAFYSCAIESTGPTGLAETQTRWASFTLAAPIPSGGSNLLAASTSTNGVTQPPPVNPYPQSTNACCVFCSYVGLNLSTGFPGWALTQNTVLQFYVTDSSGLNVYPTSSYCAIWRYGGGAGQFGCCTDANSQIKQFTAPATATYFLTIYFKCPSPPSPPAGATVLVFWGY